MCTATLACLLITACGLAPDTDVHYESGGRAHLKIPAAYFGLHLHRAEISDSSEVRTSWPAVSFGSWRLWDAGVFWPALQPEAGRWDFERLDRYVALAESAHVEILLPLGLSPRWASARPLEPSAYRPGYASEPRDLTDWREYIRTVGLRYRGRIHAYEIWNEPNLPRFYSGTNSQMIDLLREAHVTLKDIDSSIVLVSPSPTGPKGITWLEEFIRKGGARWCDVIGFHAYVGQQEGPEAMAKLIQDVRKCLDRKGLAAMPLWNTETGWRIAGLSTERGGAGAQVNGGDGLDEEAAAAYVGRAMLLGWIAGADRFFWYAWDNARMGLVLTDGKTETLAAKAFRTTSRWLEGAQVEEYTINREGVHSVHLRLKGGREGLIVWSALGKVPSYSIPVRYRSSQTLSGHTTRLSSRQRIMRVDSRMVLLEE